MTPKCESHEKRKAAKAEEGESSKKKRATAVVWTQDEVRALERAKTKLALSNTSAIKAEKGLEGRDKAQINKRLRADAKARDQACGGDGKWVDEYKVQAPQKGGDD